MLRPPSVRYLAQLTRDGGRIRHRTGGAARLHEPSCTRWRACSQWGPSRFTCCLHAHPQAHDSLHIVIWFSPAHASVIGWALLPAHGIDAALMSRSSRCGLRRISGHSRSTTRAIQASGIPFSPSCGLAETKPSSCTQRRLVRRESLLPQRRRVVTYPPRGAGRGSCTSHRSGL